MYKPPFRTLMTRNQVERSQRRRFVRNVAYTSALLVVVTMAIVQLTGMRTEMERRHEQNQLLPVQYASISNDERELALSYLKSFENLGNNLAFFHIPKTAGTSVEHAAGINKVAWGSCMFPHKPKRAICTYPVGSLWPGHIGWWHLPRFLFPLAGVDPYQNSELFGVIRSPYDRLISEYYYICSLKVLSWRPDQCDRSKYNDPMYMNEWIQSKLKNRSKVSYLADNGHFTSQHDFVFGPNQVRMLDYVLKMEDLDGPFQHLMNAFGLRRVQLEKRNALGASDRTDERSDHLEPMTIQFISSSYQHDFFLGNYTLQS